MAWRFVEQVEGVRQAPPLASLLATGAGVWKSVCWSAWRLVEQVEGVR